MSRRQSIFKRQNPGKPRVRFPDELVFQDSVKENDIRQMDTMLRRASLQMDLNAINSAGLTALHQAVLDGNFKAVRLLLKYGANVNQLDEDQWTPLHAACADRMSNIARYLLKKGANPNILTPDGERPIDLCEPDDFGTISIMLQHQQIQNSVNNNQDTESDDSNPEHD